jgi:predicted permease
MVFDKTLSLVLIFLTIFFLKKKKILRQQDGGVISTLLLYLIVPASIVTSLSGIVSEPRLWLLPLSGMLVALILLAAGICLSRLLPLPAATRNAFLIAFPTLEGGSIGFALMLSLFGPVGLGRIVLFDLGYAFCLFLLIFPLASFLGTTGPKEKGFCLKTGASRLLKNPIIWSFAFGIGFNLFHIHIELLSEALSTIAQATLVLIMILMGLKLEWKGLMSEAIFPLWAIFVKTAVGSTIGCLLVWMFGFTGVERIAIIVGSSLPVSALTVALAQEHGLDSRFLASVFSLALPCSIGVFLLWVDVMTMPSVSVAQMTMGAGTLVLIALLAMGCIRLLFYRDRGWSGLQHLTRNGAGLTQRGKEVGQN